MALQKIKIIFATASSASFVELKSLVGMQPDMEIVDFEGGCGFELMLAVQGLKPEVVVVALLENDQEPGICSHLLEEFEDLVIVALSTSKIRCLSRYSLFSFSESALLEAIRTAASMRPAA